MDRIHAVTSLARPLDLDYGTNRLVAYLTLGSAGLAAVVALGGALGPIAAGRAALVGGGAVFLSWALARELDPDGERAAFAAAGAALAWVWVMPPPSFLLALALLALLRMVNRSAGPPPRTTDSVIVLALVVWAAFTLSAWTVGAAGAAAFLLDRQLAPRGPPLQIAFAVLALAAGLAVGVSSDGWSVPRPTGAVLWVVIACGILFVLRIAGLGTVQAKSDVGGEPLSPARVRAGMLTVLGLAAAGLVVGRPGVVDAGLLWACMGGLGVAGLGRNARSPRRRRRR